MRSWDPTPPPLEQLDATIIELFEQLGDVDELLVPAAIIGLRAARSDGHWQADRALVHVQRQLCRLREAFEDATAIVAELEARAGADLVRRQCLQ